jgi:hypothetical protein
VRGWTTGPARRLGAVLGAVVVLATGCFFAEADQIQRTAPDQRPWFCNAAGDGTPISGHGNGSHVHPIYAGMTKGRLSWDDCIALSHELDRVVNAVAGRETRAKGEAAGWSSVAGYIAGLGTHHTQGLGFLSNTTFDHTKPQFLIYGGPGGDAPLVGVAYSLSAGGGRTPPPAFAGANDWWHLHAKLCYGSGGILAGAEEISDTACQALGGSNMSLPGGGIWLLHVWLVQPYEYRLDLFSSGHNCLLASGVAPPSDPCWEIAHRDPALGMPDPHGH